MFEALKQTLFSRSRAARPAPERPRASGKATPLFDDEFQRKLESLALVSRRVFAGRMRAERRSKKKGSGVEFADHRAYAPGDDFRFVDWNVYRRFGKLLVRLFEEEEDLSIYFILDCSGSMAFGSPSKFDQARRLCAALAYVGLANLDRVTLVAAHESGGSVMPSTRGKNRIFKVFQYLNQLEASGVTDLGQSLKTFVAQHKRRGLALLLSDLYDPHGFEAGINVLRYNKFEPYVLHLVEPLGGSLAQRALLGDINVYDCETGEEREVTVTERMLEQIVDAHREYDSAIQRFCTRSHVPYFAAPPDVPFDELVLRVLRRGGVLR
ncbi:MAG TPA: DUF58 domain-containing protein [Polyangiaceae bacterium]|nr:DUF58 domain-containing protein [Polyangiaceae bacterium]